MRQARGPRASLRIVLLPSPSPEQMRFGKNYSSEIAHAVSRGDRVATSWGADQLFSTWRMGSIFSRIAPLVTRQQPQQDHRPRRQPRLEREQTPRFLLCIRRNILTLGRGHCERPREPGPLQLPQLLEYVERRSEIDIADGEAHSICPIFTVGAINSATTSSFRKPSQNGTVETVEPADAGPPGESAREKRIHLMSVPR